MQHFDYHWWKSADHVMWWPKIYGLQFCGLLWSWLFHLIGSSVWWVLQSSVLPGCATWGHFMILVLLRLHVDQLPLSRGLKLSPSWSWSTMITMLAWYQQSQKVRRTQTEHKGSSGQKYEEYFCPTNKTVHVHAVFSTEEAGLISQPPIRFFSSELLLLLLLLFYSVQW